GAPMPQVETQIEQIDSVLRGLAESSEGIFDMQLTVGLRMPPELAAVHGKALASIARAAAQMDFCEFEETTIATFDAYLDCTPTFAGKNIKNHTVLSSNAVHFLPFVRPAVGDCDPMVSFYTREQTI